jgi:general stress protein 26
MFEYPLASDQLLGEIRRRIVGQEVASLITRGPEGYPRTRAMEDHNVGDDFIFHFYTDASTRKVAEIAAEPRVTIAYHCAGEGDYVCVFGRAEMVTDDAARAAHWREGWECYWPAGPTDPGFIVVRIVAEAIEYFDMHAKRVRNVTIPRWGN